MEHCEFRSAKAITSLECRICNHGPDCKDPECVSILDRFRHLSSDGYRDSMRELRWVVNPPTLKVRVIDKLRKMLGKTTLYY